MVQNLFKSIGVLLLGTFILIASQLSAGLIAETTHIPFINDIGNAIITFVVVVLLAKYLFKSNLGLNYTGVKWWWFIVAVSLPWLLNIAMVVVLKGSITVITAPMTIIAALIASLVAGFAEEVLFRGLMYTSIRSYFGQTLAILLPSVTFAAVHLLNGQLDTPSIILLLISGTAVGILFSAIRVVTGNIWTGVVVHAVWDFFVASKVFDSSLFAIKSSSSLKDNMLISGGGFGIEASMIAVLLYLVAAAIIFYVYNNQRHDES